MTVWSESFNGVVTAACGIVDGAFEVHRETGRMLRIGSEASLCFGCGPDGGVYHPDAEGPTGEGAPTMAALRKIAAAFDRQFNRFIVHSHHAFTDGRDGPTIQHAHTDGAGAHRHPDTASAFFGHRGGGLAKPAKAPIGEQRPFVELTDAERTFRVTGPYRYMNPAVAVEDRVFKVGEGWREGRKPPPEWSRAAWRQTMELTVWAARLRLYGYDPRLVGPGAITLAANRLSDDFGLTPVYEIEGWTPTPFRGLP